MVLPSGENQICLNITITDDSDAEGTETFSIFLSSDDPGVDSSASMSTVEITDDDDGAFQPHLNKLAFRGLLSQIYDRTDCGLFNLTTLTNRGLSLKEN